ncbi:MAG: phosphate ABC transporter substrate-binding protein PstS [Chloroflexi bacterium]|nr:phosphate ABC transporter substrate-binding protein PstS [Chloroflexota bacterium]
MSRLATGLALTASLVLAACQPAQPAAPSAPGGQQGGGGAPSVATPGNQGATTYRVTGPYSGEAKRLNGAGASFPAPIYQAWADRYQAITQVEINYQSQGSGAGIKAISDMTVDFGASDSPMTDQQLAEAKGGPLLHIPMVLGAVVPIYNVPELSTTKLRFTGEILAEIYLGKITKWNDPKIKAENPTATLPDQTINVVYRSDSSGTTFVWTDYLSNVSPEFKATIGAANAPRWPTGVGAPQNAGVAGQVQQQRYSIGYVEYIYAKANNIAFGDVKNKAGNYVPASEQSVSNAAKGIQNVANSDMRISIVNSSDPQAYPISSFTWQLVYVNQTDKAKAIALTRWLWWEVTDGQAMAGQLGYAPLPPEVQQRAQVMIRSIKVDGQPALPMQ